ncbi:MAG: protein kinase [Burkholderiales bacterium]
MNQGRLGRYRILGILGSGAMGIVYRAEDPLIEREVAIKTLNPSLPEDVMDEVRERFLREAKSAGRLNHPNVVTIYDVGEQDDVAYIAMELLEGRTLQQMLREPGRLPLQTVIDLAAQIADGLNHAQRFAIVHRDVKPGNVMVSPMGRAKLTDFGVAYVPSSDVTQIGTALGSPRYMSPEQVLGLPLDPRSDIFSLGTVLYEMLTGKTPFERPGEPTTLNLMNRIAREPYVPATQLDPSIPEDVDRIIGRALAKSAGDRYLNAGEMAVDLRRVRIPEPGEFAPTLKIGVPTEGRQKLPDQTSSQLLEDLEAFSRGFDLEQEARLRDEQARLERKKQDLLRWAESETRKQQEFERLREAQGGNKPRRAAAIEALRAREASRADADEALARRAQAVARIDRDLRAAYQYFAEFAAELNRVTPTVGTPYDMIYLSQSPPMALSDAFADYRTRRIVDKDVCDYAVLRYRAHYSPAARLDLRGSDIERCTEFLTAHGVQFELREAKKNDFGQATHATVTLGGLIPCKITLRADFDTMTISITLLNTGKIGRGRAILSAEALTDELVDQLGKYALGLDREFEKYLSR